MRNDRAISTKDLMISVIICSIDDKRFAAVEAMYRALLASTPFEIIRIKGATSLADGYNHGSGLAKGELVVFSHDDIEILSPDFAAGLLEHMEQFDVLGVVGTTKLVAPAWRAAGPPHVYGQVAYPEP